ncbi:MAG: DUF5320 domain-containing protein [Acidobacteria bacterium]|nr:DUF5320 domain-containing protein [Acidobacteriota bacterium]
MPYGDNSGPMGYGPRTGRGMGFCNGYDSPGVVNGGRMSGGGYGRGYGRSMGGGFGRGFGFNRGYAPNWGAPISAPVADEKQFLQAEVDALSRQLDAAKKRLDQLADDKKKDK